MALQAHQALALIAALAVMGWISPSTSQDQSTPLSEVSHIHGIGFDPAAPGGILLATHYGLFRARPDGTAVRISVDRNDYMGFSPDPASGRLLASGHPEEGGNLGVISSEDGGVTWTQVSAGAGGPVDFHAMTISRADPQRIYGLYGGIQVSRDGGTTWSIAGPGPDRVIDLAASPTEADVVYAGTVAGLMLSSDAGQTWTAMGPPDVAASMVEATGDGSVYAFLVGPGLFKLSGSDGRWSQLAADFGESYLLHLAADPSDPTHLVVVTEASAILESADGGKTWDSFGP
jgi:hypothetical protein